MGGAAADTPALRENAPMYPKAREIPRRGPKRASTMGSSWSHVPRVAKAHAAGLQHRECSRGREAGDTCSSTPETAPADGGDNNAIERANLRSAWVVQRV